MTDEFIVSTSFRSTPRQDHFRANILTLESIVTVLVFAAYLIESDFSLTLRNFCLILFCAGYYVRLNIMGRWLLSREIAFEEITFVTLIWLPAILGSFAYGAKFSNGQEVDITTTCIAVVLYTLGSYLNTCSELERKFWKQRPENKGKLYTLGWSSWSRNINYFGDSVLFSGFALMTNVWWNCWVPLLMSISFIFHHIPDKEKYLSEKYNKDWPGYVATTKSFVPFLFWLNYNIRIL